MEKSIHIEYMETQIRHIETVWKQMDTVLEKEKKYQNSHVQHSYSRSETRTISYS